jgi:hypothetical protein
VTITVPPSVKRIHGFSGAINEGGITFEINDDSTEPLVIEAISYGTRVLHKGKRPVVLKYGFYGYTSQAGAGDVIVEDVGIEGFTIRAGQHFWAHHINNEYRAGTKMTNDGGRVWIFGMKTEDRFTVIDTKNGGVTEYIGGLTYPAANTLADETIFTVDETSRLSALHSAIVYTTRFYDNAVTETKGAVTKTLTSAASPGLTRLYRSPAIGCPLDVDQTSSIRANTDAIVLARYLKGVRGAALTENARDSTTAIEINVQDRIDTRLAQLDVDGDGEFGDYDVAIVARYLIGFRGDALADGLPLTGTRSTGAAVQSYLQSLGCSI